ASDPTRDNIETVLGSECVRIDALRALSDAVASPNGLRTILLLGAQGRAKSMLLESLFLAESKRHWSGDQPALPVMLKLADCARGRFDFTTTIAAAISTFTENRAGMRVDPFEITACFRRQPFLFLIDGDDDIDANTLRQALNTWSDFRRDH